MTALALYRLPYAEQAIMLRGETEEFLSCHELNGQEGFVFAPFHITSEQPVILIHPLEMSPMPLLSFAAGSDDLRHYFEENGLRTAEPDPYYAADFATFHAQLLAGTFQKLVLSRCAVETPAMRHDVTGLFRMACRAYPRMFVSLVQTEKGGLWLSATPELLLAGDGEHWRTTALAGTMKLEGEQLSFDTPTPVGAGCRGIEWSDKNIREQRLVDTYISECLNHFTTDIHEEGPRTVRAANLAHLRSDFSFTLPDCQHVGDLLQELYPTPAVCGLPKREAFDFILQHEHTPRGYYSGFMGPLALESATHLYVNLRCMQICGNDYHLYAGGGLLTDSTVSQEWLETEAKLETMRRVIRQSSVLKT